MGHQKMPDSQPMPRRAKSRTKRPVPKLTIKATWQVGSRTSEWDALWRHILCSILKPTSEEVSMETTNLPDDNDESPSPYEADLGIGNHRGQAGG